MKINGRCRPIYLTCGIEYIVSEYQMFVFIFVYCFANFSYARYFVMYVALPVC